MQKSWSDLSDEDLLLALIDGDRPALDELFLRHSAKILGFAQKRGFSRDLSEDLVQIVFLQLWRKKHLYKSQFRGLAWIYVITKSEMRDLWLKEKRHNSETDPETLSQIPDDGPNTEGRLGDQQEIQQALHSLKPKEQMVLQMKWMDEMDYPEIAERLNESESNIRQIASRGLRALKNVFGKES